MHLAKHIRHLVADPVVVWESPSPDLLLVKEVYLHYLWRNHQIDTSDLRTTAGQQIKLVDWGLANQHDGPDFLHGAIDLDEVRWSGHIEMHVKASDWYRHQHQADPAYDQVILHVVWIDDQTVLDPSGSPIPTLCLQDYVDIRVIDGVQRFLASEHQMPCASGLSSIPPLYQADWMSGLVHDRLAMRSSQIRYRLEQLRGDWAQLSYEMLARALGCGVNADAMQYLASNCPWSLVRKVRTVPNGAEALLLGMSGQLPSSSDVHYLSGLIDQFDYFMKKYGLKPIRDIKWRTGGVRGHNQPVMRIVQLAVLVSSVHSLLDRWLDHDTAVEHIRDMPHSVPSYWRDYRMDGTTAKRDYASLSTSMVQRILINAVVPVRYAYGCYTQATHHCEVALSILQELPAERHRLTRPFVDGGWRLASAADSQAILHAYRHLCKPKKCLTCKVGCRILSSDR